MDAECVDVGASLYCIRSRFHEDSKQASSWYLTSCLAAQIITRENCMYPPAPVCTGTAATSTHTHLGLNLCPVARAYPDSLNIRGRSIHNTQIFSTSEDGYTPPTNRGALNRFHSMPPCSPLPGNAISSTNYAMFQRLFDLPNTSYEQLWKSIIKHLRDEPDDSVGLAGPSDDDRTRARFFSWVVSYFDGGISQQYWGPDTPGKWKLEKDRDS